MTTFVDNFRNLDQSTKNYFYRLASKDGRRSGAEIFRDEIPECVQDCPYETKAFIKGDASVGTEAHHASHIQSDANGGDFSNENIVMERASDNLERSSNNMTSAEQQAAIDNSQADAVAIDMHYTYDSAPVEAEVVTNDILLANSDVALPINSSVGWFETVTEVISEAVPILASAETTYALAKVLPKKLPTPIRVAAVASTAVVSYFVYQNPVAVTCRFLFKTASWVFGRHTNYQRRLKANR